MKYSELALKDWVKMKHSYYSFKITSINEEYVRGPKNDGRFSMDSIEGIPLTAFIFKRNGFDMSIDGGIVTFWRQKDNDKTGTEVYDVSIYRSGDGDLFDVHIHSNINMYLEFQAWIRSVHELQNMLRVAGLDEISDNFKI